MVEYVVKKSKAKRRKLTEEEMHDYIEHTFRRFNCICISCESLCFDTDKYCACCGAELEDEEI